MARFQLRSFDRILQDVREAQAWYASLGSRTEGTRLELIEAKTLELLEDRKTLSQREFLERWSNIDSYYVLSDGAGFGKIAREISKVGPNLLPRRALRTILEGPLSPQDEISGDASVNARNLFTELELAADFSEKGIPPTGFDDLRFRFREVDFAVQCKRLVSPSIARVKENIDKAYDQLKRDLSTDHDRGLIALAVEKVLDLEGTIFPVEEETDLTRAYGVTPQTVEAPASTLPWPTSAARTSL